jgi:hypothetical protein
MFSCPRKKKKEFKNNQDKTNANKSLFVGPTQPHKPRKKNYNREYHGSSLMLGRIGACFRKGGVDFLIFFDLVFRSHPSFLFLSSLYHAYPF